MKPKNLTNLMKVNKMSQAEVLQLMKKNTERWLSVIDIANLLSASAPTMPTMASVAMSVRKLRMHGVLECRCDGKKKVYRLVE